MTELQYLHGALNPKSEITEGDQMSEKRSARIERETSETRIALGLCLDGGGKSEIHTGIGFFDHMLSSFARHGLFDLTVRCEGDLDVDAHHTVEDVGICLGQAFAQALEDKAGIVRFGAAYVPMDEALARAVVDLSGRAYLAFDADWRVPRVGGFDTELAAEFFRALALEGRMNLHVDLLRGENGHHALEAVFKACARALDAASRQDERVKGVPSTKGVL